MQATKEFLEEKRAKLSSEKRALLDKLLEGKVDSAKLENAPHAL
jgi:hypothetical protein